jgi:hypothetical protein
MESEDMFNISELDDEQVLYDLLPIVRDKLPDYAYIVEAALNREDVKTQDLQKIVEFLTKELVPFYDNDGSLTDTKLAHIHNTAVALGRQL